MLSLVVSRQISSLGKSSHSPCPGRKGGDFGPPSLGLVSCHYDMITLYRCNTDEHLTVATICLGCSYAFPVLCSLLRRRQMVQGAPYSLGKFGYAIVSCVLNVTQQMLNVYDIEHHHGCLDQFLYHPILYA
jgi:hypothetical protein